MTNSPRRKHLTISVITVLTLTIGLMIMASTAPFANATYVSLNKQHTPGGNFNPGQQITFTITLDVRNNQGGSPIAIRGLTITDTLPTGLTYIAASETHSDAAVFNQVGQQLTWTFGGATILSTSPQAIITFTAVVNTGTSGLLVNQVNAQYTEDATSVVSNPSATDTVNIIPVGTSPTPTPTTRVGGHVETVSALQLLAPYIVTAVLAVAVVSSVAVIRHKKRAP